MRMRIDLPEGAFVDFDHMEDKLTVSDGIRIPVSVQLDLSAIATLGKTLMRGMKITPKAKPEFEKPSIDLASHTALTSFYAGQVMGLLSKENCAADFEKSQKLSFEIANLIMFARACGAEEEREAGLIR